MSVCQLRLGENLIKITGKKWKIGQKSVKEWSSGLDLTIHGSFLLLQDSPKKFIGL